mmetsp:Transcript_17689/g.44525  ORF Transcript_17689/g.44525 Transcript_17689/m.44525 type:complete len:203 (+) Transcript_17689:1160-1768(+)
MACCRLPALNASLPASLSLVATSSLLLLVLAAGAGCCGAGAGAGAGAAGAGGGRAAAAPAPGFISAASMAGMLRLPPAPSSACCILGFCSNCRGFSPGILAPFAFSWASSWVMNCWLKLLAAAPAVAAAAAAAGAEDAAAGAAGAVVGSGTGRVKGPTYPGLTGCWAPSTTMTGASFSLSTAARTAGEQRATKRARLFAYAS